MRTFDFDDTYVVVVVVVLFKISCDRLRKIDNYKLTKAEWTTPKNHTHTQFHKSAFSKSISCDIDSLQSMPQFSCEIFFYCSFTNLDSIIVCLAHTHTHTVLRFFFSSVRHLNALRWIAKKKKRICVQIESEPSQTENNVHTFPPRLSLFRVATSSLDTKSVDNWIVSRHSHKWSKYIIKINDKCEKLGFRLSSSFLSSPLYFVSLLRSFSDAYTAIYRTRTKFRLKLATGIVLCCISRCSKNEKLVSVGQSIVVIAISSQRSGFGKYTHLSVRWLYGVRTSHTAR